ncbi:MAG TPA: nucleoside-diphosphate sugar epimerase, partial [Lachnospiraceae bacterium]|nr:nucleoside-diphosphate sugar epimerase [Lachnospiraceae bacterium]
MKLFKKWDLSIVYKVLLVFLDIIFINVSSFLALWIRFNMHISEIPPEYADSVRGLVVANTIVTVTIFALFRLYTSLWRFASIKELVYIIEACGVSVL